jgi:mannitol/fructose-specific phosphotransferase system IIA component (Ntr-type)
MLIVTPHRAALKLDTLRPWMHMRLTELLVPETVVIDFAPASLTANGAKEALLSAIVANLDEKGMVADPRIATEDILARERVMSTGVGHGVAIPHAYTDGVERLLAAFYRTRAAIAFDGPDGEPVDMFFVMLGPRESRREHIRLLARLSRLLNYPEFRDSVRGARDADSAVAVFRRFGDR